MKSDNFGDLETQELVRKFSQLANERGKRILDSDTPRANKMFDAMQALDRVLRSRGPEARLALAPLLHDRNRAVRYFAAKYLLGLLPDRARAVIEAVANPKFDALSGDAGMCLYALDEGISKPD